MKMIRAVLAAAVLALLAPTAAWAQCGTTAPANTVCGNASGSSGLASWIKPTPSGLAPIAGGTVLGNPSGVTAAPVATAAPVLGIPGTSTGQIGLAGSTSGTAVLKAQAVAGSAVSLLPTSAGTLVSTALAPLAINSTTGQASITGLAGGVLAGSGPAFTRTPVLGANGTAAGTLGFAGATSGTVTVQPQAVAGTVSLTLPNTAGTFAVGATSPLVLSATTGGLTCPTCVTSSGGGAITGTSPISVSAAGVVSIPSLTGTGSTVVLSTSPTLVTPTIGVATGTSLALGGATIGTDALALTGTATISSTLTLTAGIINSPATIGLFNSGNAQKLNAASLCADSAYANCATTPTNGLQVAGQTVLSSALTYGGVTLSNSVTGTGSMVLATSPTISAPTISGVSVNTGIATYNGTSTAVSAAGRTSVVGTAVSSPSLSANGQAYLYNMSANGAVVQGQGSVFDVALVNNTGTVALAVLTGSGTIRVPGLSAGTCTNSISIDASNNLVKTACPGAASAIQVGSTSVTSATGSNRILTEGTVSTGTGTLADASITASGTTLGSVSQINASGSAGAAIQGKTTNSASSAGNVGEVINSCVLSGSAVALTTGTPVNVTSISVTAGDWDIEGVVSYSLAGTTQITLMSGNISDVSATVPTAPNVTTNFPQGGGINAFRIPAFAPGSSTYNPVATGMVRTLLSGTTTIYLVGFANFTTSTASAFGCITARRRA